MRNFYISILRYHFLPLRSKYCFGYAEFRELSGTFDGDHIWSVNNHLAGDQVGSMKMKRGARLRDENVWRTNINRTKLGGRGLILRKWISRRGLYWIDVAPKVLYEWSSCPAISLFFGKWSDMHGKLIIRDIITGKKNSPKHLRLSKTGLMVQGTSILDGTIY